MNFFQKDHIAILGFNDRELRPGGEAELRDNLNGLALNGDEVRIDLRGVADASLLSLALLRDFTRGREARARILTDEELARDLRVLGLDRDHRQETPRES